MANLACPGLPPHRHFGPWVSDPPSLAVRAKAGSYPALRSLRELRWASRYRFTFQTARVAPPSLAIARQRRAYTRCRPRVNALVARSGAPRLRSASHAGHARQRSAVPATSLFGLPGSPFPLFPSPSKRGNGAPGGARPPVTQGAAPPGAPPERHRERGHGLPRSRIACFISGPPMTATEVVFLVCSFRNVSSARPGPPASQEKVPALSGVRQDWPVQEPPVPAHPAR